MLSVPYITFNTEGLITVYRRDRRRRVLKVIFNRTNKDIHLVISRV